MSIKQKIAIFAGVGFIVVGSFFGYYSGTFSFWQRGSIKMSDDNVHKVQK